MQGNNATFTQSKLDLTADFRSKAVEGFAQDEWRVRNNLTLNYGVRYSYFGLPYDQNGQLTNFVPELWTAANAPQVTEASNRIGGNNCNGLIINTQNYTTGPASFNCTPTRSPYGKYVADVSKRDFAPRVGLSWDPFGTGLTAIRTGYGVYHEQIPVGALELFLGTNPPYQESCSVATTTLDQPVPGNNCTAIAGAGAVSIRGVDVNYKTPYMQHWSLDVQRQLSKITIVSLGSYGSKGTHLIGFTELNELQPGVATRTQCIPQTSSNTLQTPGTATVPCLVSGTAFQSSAATNIIDQIRPYRGYRSVNMLQTRYNSNYYSLQASAQQRFSMGSQINLAYTFSKNLTDNQTSVANVAPQNTYDIRADYGRASLDRQHVITVNFNYEIPFFSKQNGFLGKTLGGWQASSILSYATGLPRTITTSNYDPAGLGTIPALVAGN